MPSTIVNKQRIPHRSRGWEKRLLTALISNSSAADFSTTAQCAHLTIFASRLFSTNVPKPFTICPPSPYIRVPQTLTERMPETSAE